MTLEDIRPALMRLGFYRDREGRGERWFSPRHFRRGQVIVWLYERALRDDIVVWSWADGRGYTQVSELKTDDDMRRLERLLQER